ncbi:MAG: GTPase domain-containing protein, partial [Verrucomicrobiota bacterium]
REIQLKIVYYGCALCGKTTNLVNLHKRINSTQKGELVSLSTDADRTLFFDFLSLSTKTLPGFNTRFQLYTVPGQPVYNTTRQLVLKGVDGIVFVVDSHYDRMQENVESFANLQENLIENHLSLAQIPYVLQYNKRDLPNAAPLHYLEYTFNNRATRVLSFESSATEGGGILETLNGSARLLLAKYSKSAAGSSPDVAELSSSGSGN